jgi:ribosomal protein L28
MAKVCMVSGKSANAAKHVRHRHSAWKFRAPHKNRWQQANLQTVTIQTPGGKRKITVSTDVLKSPEFNMVLCGLKPLPKAWLKKHDYGI